MPIVALDNIITAGTAVNAAPVQGNFEKLRDAINGNNFLQLLTVADRKAAFGASPAFTWLGANSITRITVTHGLGVTPLMVIASNARFGDSDLRSPWIVTVGNFAATTFDMEYTTRDRTAISAFTVPAGANHWLAIA